MVVMSSGTAFSDCCHRLVYCEGPKDALYCSACQKPCTSSETMGQYYERMEAPKREHERLRSAVVEAAQKWRWASLRGTNQEMRALESPLAEAVDNLKKFEREHNLNSEV